MNWEEDIKKTKIEFEEKLKKIKTKEELDNVALEFLKRKGKLAQLKNYFNLLKDEEKKIFGIKFNELKNYIEKEIERLNESFKEALDSKKFYNLILSWPGKKQYIGSVHILNKAKKEIIKIFNEIGFSAIDSPEIVNEYENFDSLRIPKYHPARDLWSTLWTTKKNILLRTHTSAFQVPYLLKNLPPIRAIFIGKVYRYEATDRRHEIQFNQIEGLYIDKENKVTISQLKWVFEYFFSRFFERKANVRLRPSYFPFVEPGFEVDLKCICKKGCNICSNTGFIEIAGAGRVHPYVLKQAKLDPRFYNGFAFGCGLERILMIKYNIPDIRYFLSGDLRFIKSI
jgi:phenylalanyl-tRNA synthetase alpha chain